MADLNICLAMYTSTTTDTDPFGMHAGHIRRDHFTVVAHDLSCWQNHTALSNMSTHLSDLVDIEWRTPRGDKGFRTNQLIKWLIS